MNIYVMNITRFFYGVRAYAWWNVLQIRAMESFGECVRPECNRRIGDNYTKSFLKGITCTNFIFDILILDMRYWENSVLRNNIV